MRARLNPTDMNESCLNPTDMNESCLNPTDMNESSLNPTEVLVSYISKTSRAHARSGLRHFALATATAPRRRSARGSCASRARRAAAGSSVGTSPPGDETLKDTFLIRPYNGSLLRSVLHPSLLDIINF
jgi:hypothetical protein